MKIDLSEVQAQKSALSSSVSSIKEQLSVARSRLSQVVSTDSLKGAVKTAINQKVSNYQIPLLDNYDNALDSIVNRYEGMITLFKETAGETNDSAIINTEYLERIRERMKDPIEGLAQISARTQSIYADISDIISLPNPSLNDVNTTYANAQKSLDETIKNMGVFNQTVADSGIADLLAAQNQQLFTLKSYSSAPYTSLLSRDYYRSTAFKDDVAEYTQSIHSRGRKVKLQNQLAKQLAESKYSGAVANRKAKPRSEKKKPQTDFEKRLSKMSRAELEAEFGGVIKSYNSFSQTGYGYYVKDSKELARNQAILARYHEVKNQPLEPALKHLPASTKKEIDQSSQAQLEKTYPFLQNLTGAADWDIIGNLRRNPAQREERSYALYRYFQLENAKPVSRFDPQFMEKRSAYINETGKDPLTGKEASPADKFTAQHYGWVKATADIGASAAGGFIDYSEFFLNRSTKVQGTYNREQILRNLEESRLARESSNFDQYVKKEMLIKYPTLLDDKVKIVDKAKLPDWIGESFTDGHYRTVVTTEEVVLYRTFGGYSDAGGGFVTTTATQNRMRAKIDTALLPEWKNTRQYEACIKVPKGEELNIGKVAPQKISSSGTILKGGADQVLLPNPWPLEWIEEIRIVPN